MKKRGGRPSPLGPARLSVVSSCVSTTRACGRGTSSPYTTQLFEHMCSCYVSLCASGGPCSHVPIPPSSGMHAHHRGSAQSRLVGRRAQPSPGGGDGGDDKRYSRCVPLPYFLPTRLEEPRILHPAAQALQPTFELLTVMILVAHILCGPNGRSSACPARHSVPVKAVPVQPVAAGQVR